MLASLSDNLGEGLFVWECVECDEERVCPLVEVRRWKLSCVKEFSGVDLLSDSERRRIGLSNEDADVEAVVDDRAGTWLCTEVVPAVGPVRSKPEGWLAHPELKDGEVWGIDEFIEDAVPRLLLMGMEEAGKLVV